jgi:hypothetical protein
MFLISIVATMFQVRSQVLCVVWFLEEMRHRQTDMNGPIRYYALMLEREEHTYLNRKACGPVVGKPFILFDYQMWGVGCVAGLHRPHRFSCSEPSFTAA